jgi:hypothetical protein
MPDGSRAESGAPMMLDRGYADFREFHHETVRKVPKGLALKPQNSAKRVEEALFRF